MSSLLSCASSKRRMTSCAMCNFILASEMMLLLHFLSALAVQWSLCPSRWNGSVCCVGAFHADATTSWKRGRRVQTFSNLKGVGLRGPAWLHRSSGQWSEREEESACRTWSSKVRSQAWLQKKSVKLNQRWTALFVAPGELSVLQANFLYLTAVYDVAEPSHKAEVKISIVFVSRSVD